jgi:tetratricopeptide (TPR) repeat protein
MPEEPLCFVLMPFGSKKDPAGGPDINFDRIYEDAIRPAVDAAGMEPIRADEERTGGIIHRAMFERLLLCDFAVADLTTANANVFYELGVRHAARPATTLPIFAARHMPPFDVNYLRALPYELAEGNQFGAEQAEKLRTALSQRLIDLREVARTENVADSPIFQLLTGYGAPDVARLKTDVFRDRTRYSADIKRRLSDARANQNVAGVKAIETELGSLDGVEAGVLVDLFLSYRGVGAWSEMVRFYDRLPQELRRTVLVREQLGFALNRSKQRRDAIRVLEEIVREHGASSETNGLLGRVYKDLWTDGAASGDTVLGEGYLESAIEAYVRGFEADSRDAYPGINAVTLLDVKGDAASLVRKDELLPVVRYAVTQRLRHKEPDYWDYATLLELAVLQDDPEQARQHLRRAVTAVREAWEPATTSNNLKLIRGARVGRGNEQPWLDGVIAALDRRASAQPAGS